VPEAAPAWELIGFGAQLDLWIEREDPPSAVVSEVVTWIMGRTEDPYRGARREPGFPNLWWGKVPSAHYGGVVPVCSYWIEELPRRVRCSSVSSLHWPV
jgi:hypothetical protein